VVLRNQPSLPPWDWDKVQRVLSAAQIGHNVGLSQVASIPANATGPERTLHTTFDGEGTIVVEGPDRGHWRTGHRHGDLRDLHRINGVRDDLIPHLTVQKALEIDPDHNRFDQCLSGPNAVVTAAAEEPPAELPAATAPSSVAPGSQPPADDLTFEQKHGNKNTAWQDLLRDSPDKLAALVAARSGTIPAQTFLDAGVGLAYEFQKERYSLPVYRREELIGVKLYSPTLDLKMWSVSGSETGLFPVVKPNGDECLITEGEFDALALDKLLGDTVSVYSGTGGAGTWKDRWSEELKDAGYVKATILYDADGPGREGAKLVAASLRAHGFAVRILDIGRLCSGDEKDPTDLIRAGKGEPLAEWIGDAPWSEATASQVQDETAGQTPNNTETGPVMVNHWPTFAELAADPFRLVPPPEVVPRFVLEGRSTLLASREKFGKSTLVAAMVAAVTTGRPFLGIETPQGFVDWISSDAEDEGDILRRADHMGSDMRYARLFDGHEWQHAQFLTHLRSTDARLVVIDALLSFAIRCGFLPKSGDATEWTRIVQPLTDAVRGRVTGLLLPHHATKATGEARDSTAIPASTDIVVTAGPVPHQRRQRTIEVVGRGVRFEELTVVFRDDDTGYDLLTQSALPRPVSARQQASEEREAIDAAVSVYVREHPDSTTSKIAGDLHRRRGTIRKALERLEQDGEVVNRGGRARSLPDCWRLAE
jgi:hypothetical protein